MTAKDSTTTTRGRAATTRARPAKTGARPAKTGTSTASPAGRRLSDDDLAKVMGLIKNSDTVELKVTVPETAHRATVRGLPIDPVEAQPRQVYFFDTPDLALYNAGIVVRARRIQGGRGDTVIKLRPVVPDDLPVELRRDPSFNVEVDVLPGGFVCSGSFKGRATGLEVRDAVAGKKRISRIFSKGQRAFYRTHAPEGIDLDALVPLGPTFLLKSRFTAHTAVADNAPDRLLVAEMWLYPDGSRILELSTKTTPSDAFGVAAECRAYLASRGVSLDAVQQTKTKAALEFYGAQLAAEAKQAPTPKKPSTTPKKPSPPRTRPTARAKTPKPAAS